MNLFLKNDKMLCVLRTLGFLTTVWPLKDGASRLQVIFYKALLGFYLVNGFCMIPALIKGKGIYYRDDFGNMIRAIMELMYVFEMISSVSYCVAQEKRFRKLLAELERAEDKCSSLYEEILRRKSIPYMRLVYISSMIGYLICGGTYIFSPVFGNRNFPLNTIFPLPMLETWACCLVYAQNVFAIVQFSLVIQIDLMIITLLWNAIFKFHLLGMEMCFVFTVAKLRTAIDAHQNVLDSPAIIRSVFWDVNHKMGYGCAPAFFTNLVSSCYQDLNFSYALKSGSVISFLIFKSMVIAFINSISASLLFLHDVSLWEVVQFNSIVILSLIRLYIICSSAEIMTNTAYEISWRIYDTPWMYATPSVRRVVYVIIQRCQKSVTVSATSVVPVICVNFFRKVISAGFSYFLTLRTVLVLGDRI